MSGWMRFFLVLVGLLPGFAALAKTPATVFSNDLNTELYDCTLTVHPTAQLPQGGAIQLFLDKQGEDATVITFTKSAIAIELLRNEKLTPAGEANYPAKPGFPYRVTVQRRGDRLMLICNEAVLFHKVVPRSAGSAGAIAVDKGWTDPKVTVQRLEPVVFADNFMRGIDEKGPWTALGGKWNLRSAWDNDPKGSARRFDNAEFALNPFAWMGKAEEGSGLCTTGQPFWEDYTLIASVCPAADGAVGLAVNLAADGKNGWLVRWTPANAPGTEGNRLTLCKMVNAKLTVIAQDPGGYLPGQWYRLSVVSGLDRLRVLVDNRERLTVNTPLPWRGGIGLYVEGKNGVIFDDITAYGSGLKKELIAENMLARLNERFLNDKKGMGNWVDTAIDWTGFPGNLPGSVSRQDYHGDHWIVLAARRQSAESGEVCLALNSDGINPTSGYRAVVSAAAEKGKTTYTLYRNSVVLASRTGNPLETDVEYEYRLWHTGNRLKLEKDGDTVLEAVDEQPLKGSRPSYRITGSLTAAHSPLVLGRQVLDEAFTEAPINWIGEGTWMATTRWACSSQWSFLAGWNRGDAVLWSKQRFTGDQTFQAFVAPKMEYPREHQHYAYRFRDMAITICGDGHNARTGYTGIFGAPDEAGNPNSRSVLLRNGKVVGSSFMTLPGWIQGHIDWYDLVLKKRGATVEFWIGGRKAVIFTDPEPIEGGVPAIWTTDNGIVVARTRMFYSNPPQPRTDPQVIIDNPWYPEWANIGQALTLEFPETMSTSGKPVQFRITPRNVPTGDENAIAPAKDRVTFKPTALGEHWYQITAEEGETASPAMHLALQVYQPALGRDDSHAVVLYRFDEGKGKVVKDQSKVAPQADLTIENPPVENPAPAVNGIPPVPEKKTTEENSHPAEWCPGQGLHLPGPNRLATAGAVAKLMNIAKTKACTLEFWISPDTVYPTTDWLGVILTWELPYDKMNERRNFGFANMANFWTLSPSGSFFGSRYGRSLTVQGAHNGLQHVVVTWSEQITRLYVNSEQLGEKWGSWQPQSWDANAPLILGNQPEGLQRYYLREAQGLTGAREDIIGRNANGQHCFLGSYYLVAVHDNCFSEEQIKRHYQAGPSAK